MHSHIDVSQHEFAAICLISYRGDCSCRTFDNLKKLFQFNFPDILKESLIHNCQYRSPIMQRGRENILQNQIRSVASSEFCASILSFFRGTKGFFLCRSEKLFQDLLQPGPADRALSPASQIDRRYRGLCA